ncbi:MAG: hypothetical protein ACRYFS_16115 [Janthinobacterium lividum]
MARVWLTVANIAALGVWAVSWFIPLNIALPQGEAMPSQWEFFVLRMQVHWWEATVPVVLCLDVILLTQVLRRS